MFRKPAGFGQDDSGSKLRWRKHLAFSAELGGNESSIRSARRGPSLHLDVVRAGAISILGLSVSWLLLAGGYGHGQETQPTEYQIKAAFLFNFAKFVQWPPQAFADANSPMIIGVLGQNPFHEDLARTIRNKTIDDHPLVIKEFNSLVEVTNCHILFISTSEKRRLPQIFEGLNGANVLTVGETERFTESGGIINFVLEGTKIRFQINESAAKAAGLKLSSKLLSLAIRTTQ